MKKMSKAKKAAKNYEKVKKTSKFGSGKRFKALTGALTAKGYSKKSAGAIAASAGRKAHGKKAMAKAAAAGRRKKSN